MIPKLVRAPHVLNSCIKMLSHSLRYVRNPQDVVSCLRRHCEARYLSYLLCMRHLRYLRSVHYLRYTRHLQYTVSCQQRHREARCLHYTYYSRYMSYRCYMRHL